MMAVHHASNGDARQEFINWSASDRNYEGQSDLVAQRWDSLDAGRGDGVTYKTLNKILREHGASDVQIAVDVGDDFPDDMSEDTADGDEAPKYTIELTPYVSMGKQNTKKREWLYKPVYIRKFVGLTVATGGAGKSSLILVECIAMAAGKDLLGVAPVKPLKVFYWNGEDPQDELERRVEAIMDHFNITQADIDGRFFLKSGRDLPIKIATVSDRGQQIRIAKPVVKAMRVAIRDNGIDVVGIDPFVSSHTVPENDNGAIEIVAKKWSDIAEKENCAIHLSHHTRKGNGESVSMADSRGASALNNAARTRRAIATMTAAEAGKAGIVGSDRYSYFKADMGGSSMIKPSTAYDWYRFVSVDMENGATYEDESDSVGVVVSWEYKAVTLELDAESGRAAVAALREGGPWRADKRADNWAGKAIAKALSIDLTQDGNAKKVDGLLRDWVREETLEEYEAEDEQRRTRKFLRVGNADDKTDELDFG